MLSCKHTYFSSNLRPDKFVETQGDYTTHLGEHPDRLGSGINTVCYVNKPTLKVIQNTGSQN